MSEGYDQNSEEINISVKDLISDFSFKHQDNVTPLMVEDLFVILTETFGDGFIQGFNLGVNDIEKHPDHLEWWEHQDGDDAWVDSYSLEDLELYYGEEDVEYWQSLYDQMGEMDIIPGSAIGRKKDGDE